MADVFISYKREDRENARLIAEALKTLTYEVWWDIELLPGQKFSQEIREIISVAKAAIVLWSEAAVTSPYVIDEATLALSRGILIPIKLDACEIPLGFGGLHTLDLSEWRSTHDITALQPLLKAVEYKVEQTSKSGKEPPRKRNIHKPEVDAQFWRGISERETQSLEEYQLYLKKFGENAMFADLARLRITALRDAKDSSNKLSAKKLLTIITTAVGILTGIATLVLKSDEVVKLFIGKGAEVETVAKTDTSHKEKTPPTAKTLSKQSHSLNHKNNSKAELNIPLTATAKPQQEPENIAEFAARTIIYELKYATHNKGKADKIEKYIKKQGLNIQAIPLFTVPSKFSNKIFYTRENKSVAIWIQESIKDISFLELNEYEPSENAKEKPIRIILGD